MKYEKVQSKVASEESAQPVVKPGVQIPDNLDGLKVDVRCIMLKTFALRLYKYFLFLRYVIAVKVRDIESVATIFMFICARMTILVTLKQFRFIFTSVEHCFTVIQIIALRE